MSAFAIAAYVVGHPLVITLIVCYAVRTVCYVVRIGIFVTASIVVIRTSDDNRPEACLKLAEITCPRWPWQHPPTGPPK